MIERTINDPRFTLARIFGSAMGFVFTGYLLGMKGHSAALLLPAPVFLIYKSAFTLNHYAELKRKINTSIHAHMGEAESDAVSHVNKKYVASGNQAVSSVLWTGGLLMGFVLLATPLFLAYTNSISVALETKVALILLFLDLLVVVLQCLLSVGQVLQTVFCYRMMWKESDWKYTANMVLILLEMVWFFAIHVAIVLSYANKFDSGFYAL